MQAPGQKLKLVTRPVLDESECEEEGVGSDQPSSLVTGPEKKDSLVELIDHQRRDFVVPAGGSDEKNRVASRLSLSAVKRSRAGGDLGSKQTSVMILNGGWR